MWISTVDKAFDCTQEVSTTDSPRLEGFLPVRGNFLAEFIILQIWRRC